MKKLAFLLPFLGLLFLGACQSADTSVADQGDRNDVPEIDAKVLAEGFQLLETNCFSCHSPNASIENRMAPPMEAVKRHYLKDGMTEAQFSKDFIAFLQNPNEETSQMPGAIRRFGLMPKMSFAEAQLQSIATYIYHTKLEQPEWFEKHYQEERAKHMEADVPMTLLEKGQKIAMQTKAVLGKNLLTAINTKGTDEALAFCTTRAIPLTDSMSLALKASIKRVSDRNRNPDNAANAAELDYIKSSKALLAEGKTLMPKLIEADGKSVGYYPIMTNGMCLQCHGAASTEIQPSTLAKIHDSYPGDLAKGYKADELRGIWVVEMSSTSK